MTRCLVQHGTGRINHLIVAQTMTKEKIGVKLCRTEWFNEKQNKFGGRDIDISKTSRIVTLSRLRFDQVFLVSPLW